MNTTNHYYLVQISNSFNKNHWRVRSFRSKIENQISGLRLLAMEKRGTFVSSWSNREANILENNLKLALVNKYK